MLRPLTSFTHRVQRLHVYEQRWSTRQGGSSRVCAQSSWKYQCTASGRKRRGSLHLYPGWTLTGGQRTMTSWRMEKQINQQGGRRTTISIRKVEQWAYLDSCKWKMKSSHVAVERWAYIRWVVCIHLPAFFNFIFLELPFWGTPGHCFSELTHFVTLNKYIAVTASSSWNWTTRVLLQLCATMTHKIVERNKLGCICFSYGRWFVFTFEHFLSFLFLLLCVFYISWL